MKTLEQRIAEAISSRTMTADSAALTLDLELTLIIMHGLRRKRWNVLDLAKATGLTKTTLTRILTGGPTTTTDQIGMIFFALGIRVNLNGAFTEPVEKAASASDTKGK